MEESLGVGRWVDLDYQIDLWDIETTGGHISGEKDHGSDGVEEFGEVLSAHGRRVFAVERDQREGRW
jgi:hypothetical protein